MTISNEMSVASDLTDYAPTPFELELLAEQWLWEIESENLMWFLYATSSSHGFRIKQMAVSRLNLILKILGEDKLDSLESRVVLRLRGQLTDDLYWLYRNGSAEDHREAAGLHPLL